MPEFESPTCALDLRDPSTGLNIAMAKPGEKIRVIVRVEDNATAAKLMEAVGALSNDGKTFSVVVTREDGAQQTQDVCYRDLLRHCRPSAKSDFLLRTRSEYSRPNAIMLSLVDLALPAFVGPGRGTEAEQWKDGEGHRGGKLYHRPVIP